MSLTSKVLIALVAGMALGVLASRAESRAVAQVIAAIEPVGVLFINAIRMTVVPLVMGSLIAGVAAAPNPRAIGRIGVRALAFFLVTLLAGALFAALAAPPLFALVPIDPAAREAMTAASEAAARTTAEGVRRAPGVAQWLVELVPANPLKAAADGAMLPLIVFSLLLGLAATRLTPERRDRLVAFFRAGAETALVLVRWVLRAAPLGVFALALPLAARLGASSASVVASYVVIVVVLSVVFTAALFYPLAAIGGRTSVARFARAALPAQAVALSARSSLASLPAMMESARSRLGLREDVVGFLLPLAASTYRIGGAVGMVVATVFLAHLYGVALGPTALASVVLAATVATLSVPGIPAGSVVAMAPVLMTAGVDLAGLGILIGLDAIPDMFRTASNVTGDMAVATVLGRDDDAARRRARA